MNPQRLLEESIIGPPPPFGNIDELIARERRRGRARRTGAICAGAAGVLAVALGVVTIGGPALTDDAPTIGTTDPSTVATPEDELARLAALLTTRLSTVLPGSVVAADDGTGAWRIGTPVVFRESATFIPGYRATSTQVAVAPTADAALTTLTVGVLTPLTTAPAPTAGRLTIYFGGCAGMWSDLPPVEPDRQGCRERRGPRGSTVYYGWRNEDSTAYVSVTISYLNGTFVYASADGDHDTIMFTDETIADLIADPGFAA